MPQMDSSGGPRRILISTSADNLHKVLTLLKQNSCINITISQTHPLLRGTCDSFLSFLKFELSVLWVAAHIGEEVDTHSWIILSQKLNNVATVLEAPEYPSHLH